jgi:hypothetical protein
MMKDIDNVKTCGKDEAKFPQGFKSTNTNILRSSSRQSRGSSVSLVTMLRTQQPASHVRLTSRTRRLSPRRPARIWGPASLLENG